MGAIDRDSDEGGDWITTNAPFVVDSINRAMPMIQFALDGTVLAANDRYLRLFGMKTCDVVGRHHSLFLRAGDAEKADYAALWKGLRAGRPLESQCHRATPDGRSVWLQATYLPICDPDGGPRRIVKIASDITREHEDADDQRQMLDAISRSTATIEFALDGTILAANPLYLQITGYTEAAIRGRHHRMFLTEEDAGDPRYDEFWARLRRGEFIREEFRRVGRDGRPIWLLASYNPILDASGVPARIIKIVTDITESVQLRQETARQAFSDALTHLANRRRFDQTLADEVRLAMRQGRDLSLVLVDIDHFKRFNDRFGHQQGDACLRIVANTIRSAVRRATDLVARFGGEEFAVLLPNAGPDFAAAVSETIRAAVETIGAERTGVACHDFEHAGLTVSLGHASLRPEPLNPDVLASNLIKRADRALYRAKDTGRNAVCGDFDNAPTGGPIGLTHSWFTPLASSKG